MTAPIRVQVVQAWPRRHASCELALQHGATVADALLAIATGGFAEACDGVAIYGERVGDDRVLVDGDRIELLRQLQIDPKEARRRRAARNRSGR